jgi:hypothetical protein
MKNLFKTITGTNISAEQELQQAQPETQSIEEQESNCFSSVDEVLASLTFVVLKNGDVNAYCDWKQETP